MRRHFSWWTLTGRDEALRNGHTVDPWKMGDYWVSLSDPAPWPWPKTTEAR